MRYCIGDIHGCYKTFKELILQLFLESKHPDIYIVGDIIDRGPNSKAVIDLIFDLRQQGFTIECVCGNHEDMLKEAYQKNLKLNDTKWQLNGAKSTISSFNPQADLNLKVKELIPNHYYKYLSSLPYFIELDDYIIVHAGLNFKANNPFSDLESMLWTREENYDYNVSKGRKIIHGHTPVPFDQIRSNLTSNQVNVINIDSGCVYTQHPGLGSLTAINLDTNKLFNIPNID
ncbi:MAG TPA: hypothetical protein DCG75_06665 [Bacteroidales bacterium]|jgi:serine/threonine protein phosphatase 1|nr:hypothetical protein [Bacteroidales bacterium]